MPCPAGSNSLSAFACPHNLCSAPHCSALPIMSSGLSAALHTIFSVDHGALLSALARLSALDLNRLSACCQDAIGPAKPCSGIAACRSASFFFFFLGGGGQRTFVPPSTCTTPPQPTPQDTSRQQPLRNLCFLLLFQNMVLVTPDESLWPAYCSLGSKAVGMFPLICTNSPD